MTSSFLTVLALVSISLEKSFMGLLDILVIIYIDKGYTIGFEI